MLKLWEKKGKKATKPLTAAQRADILAMYEQEYLPSEIAQELNLDAACVSKVIELDKRKQKRITSTDNDELKQINLDIKKLELEHKKKMLQWDYEDREAQRKAEIAEDLMDSVMPEAEQDPLSIMLTAFMSKFLSNNPNSQPNVSPAVVGASAQNEQQFQAAPPTAAGLSFIELSEDEIKSTISQYPQQAAQLQKLPDTMIKKILIQKFPYISDDSIDLALNVLKKTKIKV